MELYCADRQRPQGHTYRWSRVSNHRAHQDYPHRSEPVRISSSQPAVYERWLIRIQMQYSVELLLHLRRHHLRFTISQPALSAARRSSQLWQTPRVIVLRHDWCCARLGRLARSDPDLLLAGCQARHPLPARKAWTRQEHRRYFGHARTPPIERVRCHAKVSRSENVSSKPTYSHVCSLRYEQLCRQPRVWTRS